MNRKEIIEEIAKRHHIILSENDPIFAVVSANEIMFDSFLERINLLFTKHKTDLESYKVNISKEVKEYSKNHQEALRDILTPTNQNIITPKETDTKDKRKVNNLNFWLPIIASQIIFLFIGLIIGITI